MKDFMKYTFATVVGIFITFILMFLLSMISIAGMVASESATKSIDDNSVLVLNLSGTMTERSESDFMAVIGGNVESFGLDKLMLAVRKAAKNDEVKGIYIEAGAFEPDSYASLLALRRELSNFRKTGKWIVAYGDTYTQSLYYLCSVADKVYLNPEGMIEWKGLASQPLFLKDVLAKFGIKMQLVKVGNYKSAPEMYVADKMSDFNREQVSAYVNGIWSELCKAVSDSRHISVDKLNMLADDYMTYADQQLYVKEKLVDKLLYTDEVRAEIKKRLDLDEDDDIRQLNVQEMCSAKDRDRDGEEIAVYYAVGDIVASQAASVGGSESNINSMTVVPDLEALAKDDDVKAVVLRVNSGGGSAYASEQIWRAVQKLKEKKPVVVSMGGMAASGGYYISCGSDWIVAEPTTLTGSIGIFGLIPDMSELLTNKLGVKFDLVKTNTAADMGTMSRPLNETETQAMQAYVDRGYTLFRKRVCDGRKMKLEELEPIAQGHVWIGSDAKKIKLVDQLGSLDDAIAKAAKLAKLDSYHTNSYPSERSFFETLMERTTNTGSYLDGKMQQQIEMQMQEQMGILYEPLHFIRNLDKRNMLQARIPYYINIQ